MKQDKWSRSERNGLEHGVHLPEAAAWRSNAAWLAWAAVHLEFLAQSANQCFPAMGLDIPDWETAFAAHRETSRSGVRNDLRESAASYGTAGPRQMHRTTHKTGWGGVGGRAAGILVLLAGILLSVGWGTGAPQANPVPSLFDS